MIRIIRQIALDHSGGFYLFKINEDKANKICKNFFFLKRYLDEVFQNCPNDYFKVGPRSSNLKFKIPVKMIEIQGHEVSSLVRFGLEFNKDRFQENHLKVQSFMLENDNNTIAIEVPTWIEPNEIDGYSNIFKSDFPLTGHIDILRVEDDKIWVWDYKPRAIKEKFAATQVYFYTVMLSKRTGIEIDKFRCGYFDKDYAFLFRPEKDVIVKNQELTTFI